MTGTVKTTVKTRDYIPAGTHCGVPFTSEQLAEVPDDIKAAFIDEARSRFPRTAIIAANCMLGAYAYTLRALQARVEVEVTDGSN